MPRVVNAAYHQYIASPEWKAKRAQRLALDNAKCTRCDSTETLQVHHLTYDRLGSERIEDLITLCEPCHKKDHGLDPTIVPVMDWRWAQQRSSNQGRMNWVRNVRLSAFEVDRALAQLVHALEDWHGEGEADPRLTDVRTLLTGVMNTFENEYGSRFERMAEENAA